MPVDYVQLLIASHKFVGRQASRLARAVVDLRLYFLLSVSHTCGILGLVARVCKFLCMAVWKASQSASG